ncbi:hypothetical protein AKO1_007498 [Acrasis kona]|uniref:Uncharacterized protein n=1 Tax=Acrasis kona TaxID=1008807 RepID=A0AAW2YSF1_9EUKA
MNKSIGFFKSFFSSSEDTKLKLPDHNNKEEVALTINKLVQRMNQAEERARLEQEWKEMAVQRMNKAEERFNKIEEELRDHSIRIKQLETHLVMRRMLFYTYQAITLEKWEVIHKVTPISRPQNVLEMPELNITQDQKYQIESILHRVELMVNKDASKQPSSEADFEKKMETYFTNNNIKEGSLPLSIKIHLRLHRSYHIVKDVMEELKDVVKIKTIVKVKLLVAFLKERDKAEYQGDQYLNCSFCNKK